MQTSQDVKLSFRDYGEIVIPKGTRLTHQTATGEDKNYHFVNEFGWIERDYPEISRVLRHDAIYHGIDIPKKFVTEKY
jgi:hypothetical protein